MPPKPRQYGTLQDELTGGSTSKKKPFGGKTMSTPRFAPKLPFGRTMSTQKTPQELRAVLGRTNDAPAVPRSPGRSALSVLSDKTIPLKERWSVSTPRDSGPLKDNTQYSKTLEDFLAMAQQIIGGQTQSQLSGISNQEAALRQNADEIRGKIAGGYNALSSYIGEQAPVIQQNFDTGIEGIGNSAEQAQASISKGTAAAQAQQQAILDRLGNSDANISIANNGTTLEAQMAQQIADSAQRAQGAQTQLQSNAVTERNYNTSMGTSAAMEGQGQQDRIGRDLLSRLAELADQRQLIQSGSQMDASRLASDLMDRDYGIWSGNYDRRFNADKSAMDFAQQQAQLQAEQQAAMNKPQEMTTARWSTFGPPARAAYALENSGVAPDQARAIVAEIDQYYGDGGANMTPSQFVTAIQKLARDRGLDPVSTSNAAAVYREYFGN